MLDAGLEVCVIMFVGGGFGLMLAGCFCGLLFIAVGVGDLFGCGFTGRVFGCYCCVGFGILTVWCFVAYGLRWCSVIDCWLDACVYVVLRGCFVYVCWVWDLLWLFALGLRLWVGV